MNCERWSQIRDLFDATVSLPPSERWIGFAAPVATTRVSETTSSICSLMTWKPTATDFSSILSWTKSGSRATGDWPPCGDRLADANREYRNRQRTPSVDRSECFSPKAAIASDPWQRSDEETRAIAQSRLRNCRSFTSSSSA